MSRNGQIESASRKKIQKLSKDGPTVIHPPMISGPGQQTGSKSTLSDENVYPNENVNRPGNPDRTDPNRPLKPDSIGL
jgi:hypothetical protein